MTSEQTDVISPAMAPTLDRMFVERIRRSPDTVAYISHHKDAGGWVETSWQDMGRRIGRWQVSLAREGLASGDRVALLLRNGEDWITFDQAALGLGLVVVPLYTDDRPDNIAYILRDAGVRLLLIQDAGRWKRLAPAAVDLPDLRRVLVLAGDGVADDGRVRMVAGWLADEGPSAIERQADGHDLASIVYTSGTTGRPKGVMLSHDNMLSVAYASLQRVDCYPCDRFLSFLPLSHTLERTAGYYLPAMAGSSVAFSRSVMQLADDLKTVRPTVMVAVPRIFERVYGRIQAQMDKRSSWQKHLFDFTVRVGWRRFNASQGRVSHNVWTLSWPLLDRLVARKVRGLLGGRLRMVVSGGAALPRAVARAFASLDVPILQGYGMTETSPVISVNIPEDNDPLGVGLPLPGIEVRLGEDDELQVRGPGVMLGYWNNPEATAAILEPDGWLHTGDQVRMENGHLYITGRIKDILVLSNGEKVPPGDLELAIGLDPWIDQVMVVGEGQAFLAAIVVVSAEHWDSIARDSGLDPQAAESVDAPKLKNAVLGRIGEAIKDFPGYVKIRRVLLQKEPWSVENGLLTPTLKVKRAKVLERFADEIDGLYSESKSD
ncbi:MAG: long-chain fatty acid--CoA ligase [Chromatiales bacterium]|nr:long-chain fatty acid--CoA ligase [Chromatiales bacterium]